MAACFHCGILMKQPRRMRTTLNTWKTPHILYYRLYRNFDYKRLYFG